MWGFAFDILKGQWKKLAVGGMVVLIAGAFYLLYEDNAHLRNVVAEQKASIVTFQKNEKQYQQTINNQNQSIVKLQTKADSLKKKVVTSSNKIAKIQSVYEHRIIQLSHARPPKTCKGSMKYLLNNAIKNK